MCWCACVRVCVGEKFVHVYYTPPRPYAEPSPVAVDAVVVVSCAAYHLWYQKQDMGPKEASLVPYEEWRRDVLCEQPREITTALTTGQVSTAPNVVHLVVYIN